MADCGSRIFKEWEARNQLPHRLTTKEMIESRRLAWNAAIDRAVACITICGPHCDICVSQRRAFENLKAEALIPRDPHTEEE